MKGSVVSNCEKEFITEAIRCRKRLDGRSLDEFRNLEINFGTDYGCCYVSLGETKVLTQVSCELDEPSPTRPNEGHLYVNMEYGAMASLAGEAGRQSQMVIHISRFLEKCFKESRCMDLEALCIISEEKVWTIRVMIIVLNNDGNLLTCSSVSTLAALAHFRTPAVTFEENEIIIHDTSKRLPVPLTLHHFPIAVSYALFDNGEIVVNDPTELEEKISEAELVYGVNSFRELCTLHFSGKAVMNHNIALSRAHEASRYAVEIVKKIKGELENDNQKRVEEMGEGEGLVNCINSDRLLAASRDRNSLRLTQEEINVIFSKHGKNDTAEEDTSGNEIVCLSTMPPSKAVPSLLIGGVWTPKGGKSSWVKKSDSESEESQEEEEEGEDDDVEVVGTITDADRIVDNIVLSGDSEEEETTILHGTDVEKS